MENNLRVHNLMYCAGLNLEALLAEAAHTTVICDRCILKAECDARPARATCQEIWLDYLKGETVKMGRG